MTVSKGLFFLNRRESCCSFSFCRPSKASNWWIPKPEHLNITICFQTYVGIKVYFLATQTWVCKQCSQGHCMESNPQSLNHQPSMLMTDHRVTFVTATILIIFFILPTQSIITETETSGPQQSRTISVQQHKCITLSREILHLTLLTRRQCSHFKCAYLSYMVIFLLPFLNGITWYRNYSTDQTVCYNSRTMFIYHLFTKCQQKHSCASSYGIYKNPTKFELV